MPQIKTIADIQDREDLILCQHSGEFEDLCDSVGLPRYNRQYTYGFVKLGDGEILELWGFDGSVPWLDKALEQIYPTHSTARAFELSHTFYTIGELTKTKRFPKQRETFIQRVESWIAEHRPNAMPQDTARFAVIAAFNFRWVNVSALELNGIDRESLWLTR